MLAGPVPEAGVCLGYQNMLVSAVSIETESRIGRNDPPVLAFVLAPLLAAGFRLADGLELSSSSRHSHGRKRTANDRAAERPHQCGPLDYADTRYLALRRWSARRAYASSSAGPVRIIIEVQDRAAYGRKVPSARHPPYFPWLRNSMARCRTSSRPSRMPRSVGCASTSGAMPMRWSWLPSAWRTDWHGLERQLALLATVRQTVVAKRELPAQGGRDYPRN